MVVTVTISASPHVTSIFTICFIIIFHHNRVRVHIVTYHFFIVVIVIVKHIHCRVEYTLSYIVINIVWISIAQTEEVSYLHQCLVFFIHVIVIKPINDLLEVIRAIPTRNIKVLKACNLVTVVVSVVTIIFTIVVSMVMSVMVSMVIAAHWS